MKVKIIYILSLLVFFVAAVFGGIKRGTYTNVTAEENFMDKCYVAPFPDSLLMLTENGSIEEAMHTDSQYVVKVKAAGAREFLFGCSLQEVVVEEVLDGDKGLEGEKIELLLGGASMGWDDPESPSQPEVSMYYRNDMEQGKEYLVYLEGKVDTLDAGENVYSIPGTTISPIFAFEDGNSIPTGEQMYVLYEKVKDCEYFAQTQAGIDGLYALKEYVMHKWAN